jgi:hypothetical protein
VKHGYQIKSGMTTCDGINEDMGLTRDLQALNSDIDLVVGKLIICSLVTDLLSYKFNF